MNEETLEIWDNILRYIKKNNVEEKLARIGELEINDDKSISIVRRKK